MQESAYLAVPGSLETLARDLIGRRPGERLPTVLQYQELLGVGSGTVQARLRILESAAAIRLEHRGHQGTYLLERDLSELWSLGRLGPLRGVLPLPEALEPVALAVTLRREFDGLKVPLELMYGHGSARRVQMVRERSAHFAVASAPAAREATSGAEPGWLTIDFGPETYHRDDAMVVIVRPHLGADDTIIRIGIDPASLDHSRMTQAEFPSGEGYQYSAYPHARLPAAVAEGLIDAAVWHNTALVIPLSAVGIAARPLHRSAAISVSRAMGCAVLVARRDTAEVLSILESLDFSSVRRVQDEILGSEMLPLY
jgi:hypothetical protein